MSYVTYLQLRHIVGTYEQEISFQTWVQRWGMNSGLSHREHGWDIFDKGNSERRANGQGELLISPKVYWDFPDGSDSKEPACNEGDLDWIFGTGRYSEKGNGYPLQYFCLENSMDKGADGLQSMGPQRVGHSWVTNIFTTGSSLVVLMVKNMSANAGNVRDAGSIPGLGRSPGRGHWQPTPVFLPRESHGQRSLVGYSP